MRYTKYDDQEIQNEAIPWQELEVGKCYVNYGDSGIMQMHIIKFISGDYFTSTYVFMDHEILSQKKRFMSKDMWDKFAETYKNDLSDHGILFDEERNNNHYKKLFDAIFRGVRIDIVK